MSLQNLATQMAAQGRGPDRTLVHMSPKEVQGLQALAMAHGGSLTINPETGLPEAGFLESILPAVAGFALNAFAPGVGTAVGGMLGLGEAAGTALTVGGIAGLASGSLEKGIMAGMGAYGGAGLAGSLMNSGTSALTQAGVDAAGGAAALGGDASGIAQKVADASTFDKLKSGFSAAASTPKDFLSDNKFAIGAALLPAIAGGLNDKGEGTGAPKTPKYIRRYETDPVTGEIRQAQAISTDDFGDQPAVSFGGVRTRGMADGGPITFGGVPASTKVIDPYDTRTDSQKSLDYLMGKSGATNPMLFTHKKATGPIEPADMATRKGGHYVLDAATNTYVWVPDATPVASTGIAGLSERMGGGFGGGGDGGGTGSTNDNGYNPSITGLSVDKDGKVVSTNNTLLGLASYLPFVGNLFRSYQQEKQEEANAANAAVESAGKNAAMAVNPMSQDPSQIGITNGTFAAQQAANQAMTDAANAQATANAIARGYHADVAARGGSFDNSVEGSAGYGSTASGGIDGSMYSQGGMAGGGLGNLGGYSDGGQLLRGPGDGVSDSIPAKIAGNQPARLADGEFVIPARIVSEIGNGSTDAGARELYKMMARVQAGRAKTVGKNKTAVNSKSARHLPA